MKGQEPESQTNLLVAIVLSMAIMLGWQYFYAGPSLERQAQQRQAEEQAAQNASGGPPGAPSGQTSSSNTSSVSPSGDLTTAPAALAPKTRQAALSDSQRITIDTPSLKGSIALKGALIDDLIMKKYRVTSDPKSEQVTLFSPLGAPSAYLAEYGWRPTDKDISVPTSDTVWTIADGAGALTPENPVVLTWDNGSGLTFKRTISIDENYLFTVNSEVSNSTAQDIALAPYARIYHVGTPTVSGFVILHEGLVGVLGDEGLQEITYAGAVDGGSETFRKKTGGWLGITEKYWGSAIIPDQKAVYTAHLSGRPAANGRPEYYIADYTQESLTVPAGQTTATTSRLYAGAKKQDIIDSYGEKYEIKDFDRMIDWGWFYFITRPLNRLLTWLFDLFGNFGVAILVTTVLVKLAFYPLANKSYESMGKMKKLQPQMEELRERHKDDKPRLQQEMMQLYQREKINPLAGCLPILLQIPVFFALYKVLFVSIDMRHAPFFGWIQDLSAPDPTSIFNLFGLLPFDVPGFLLIGIWPILMGLTMWLQMQLNPPQPDPIQQQVFNWMPVLFTFLLAGFPAGLVIYWAWNNVLSLAQQYYIMTKQGADIHLMENIASKLSALGSLFKGGKKSKG